MKYWQTCGVPAIANLRPYLRHRLDTWGRHDRLYLGLRLSGKPTLVQLGHIGRIGCCWIDWSIG